MMSNNSTTNVEIMTISEAAHFVGVSTKTIERHALLHKYPDVWTTKNRRKTKGYSKEWLIKIFDIKDNVGQQSDASQTQVGHMSDNKTTENKEVIADHYTDTLKGEIDFLRSEIGTKNNQIEKLQELNIQLVQSELKTKTLLADLQIQQKQLISAKPDKAMGKKYTWVWWLAFFVLLGGIGAGCYFGYQYVITVLEKA